MIVIWYLQYPLKVLVQIFKNKLNKKNFKLASLFFIIMFFIIVMSIKNFNQISIFLQGTGLGNTASHSVIERNKQFYDTITVFKNNLLKGVGLGGVNLEVARLNGIITDRHSDITGMSVFAEVLAASGLIGFIFFAIYIFKLIQKPVNVIKTTDIDLQNKIIVKSLIISFIFELTILQFNQNILRIYLWIHISILSLNYYRVIRNYSKRDSNSRREINGK